MIRLRQAAPLLLGAALIGCGGGQGPTPTADEVQQNLDSQKNAREAYYKTSPPGKKTLSPQEKARQNNYRRSG